MRLVVAILSLIFSCAVFGQTYTITTVAGGSNVPPDNVLATSVTLPFPLGVAFDSKDNAFIVANHSVFRIDAIAHTLTRVAGNGTPGFSGDNGPATNAQLNYPSGVAVDSAGNLYIADQSNYRIRKVSNGVITTVAGNGTRGFSGDNGPATSAQLGPPKGVAVDSSGDVYIADGALRKVHNGVITTVAGAHGIAGNNGDNGPANDAWLSTSAVTLDSAGNIYVIDVTSVRKISNGVITTVAGKGKDHFGPGYNGDGPATSALLNNPTGISVDSAGNLYIADSYNCLIRKVSNGVMTTVAGMFVVSPIFGGPIGGFSGDNGPAASSQLNYPYGVAVNSVGDLYVADQNNDRVRKVSNGVIITVTGGGASGDNGPATSAQLYHPFGVAADPAGNFYVADFGTYRIRKVSNGEITTVAGNGTPGFSGDNGPATSASLYPAEDVAVDSAGNVYIPDNNRIRKVSNGVITTVAGGGASGDDGPATSAQLNVGFVTVDSAGNLYVVDGSRIRKVSNGVITTVAGSGTPGFSGDNGPAKSAQLSGYFITVDSAGNLYIADLSNYRIRKVSNGVITTVAGNGTPGFSGDNGPATSAQLGSASGVAVDSVGNLYIVDSANYRIRKVSNGIITTVAGNGAKGFSGDNGPATSAQLNGMRGGIAVDAIGNVYFEDNDRVRVLTPVFAVAVAAPAALSSGVTGVVYGSVQFVATGGTGGYSWSATGLPAGLEISPNGLLSGTPTMVSQGAYTPQFTVTDSSNTTATVTLTLNITAPGSTQFVQVNPLFFTMPVGGPNPKPQAVQVTSTGADFSFTTQIVSGNAWLQTSCSSSCGTPFNFTVGVDARSLPAGIYSGEIAFQNAPLAMVAPVTLTITSGTPKIGALAHFAAGDTWTTGFFVLNTGSSAAQFSITFHGDDGNLAMLPFSTGSTSTLTGTVPANGSAYFEAGNAQAPLIAGWGQITADPSIVVQALFRNNANGTYFEAAVPSGTGGKEFLLPFDATTFAATTAPFYTGFALANLDQATAVVSCVARDPNGVAIPGAVPVPPLAPLGHWANYLFPVLTGKRGTIDCASNTNVAAIAIRSIGTNAFSSLPVIPNPSSFSSSPHPALAHFAAGDVWTTGFFVLNTGSSAAQFSVTFHDDKGNLVSLPFAAGPANNISGTVAAQGSAYYEAGNSQIPLASGWGQITADPTIVVQALFRDNSKGTYYEAAVPSTFGSKEFLLPFDATIFAVNGSPFYTGFAIVNLDQATANVTCIARDSTGVVIPNAVTVPQLNPIGHWANYLFPALSGKRGTIDCVSNTNVAAMALRSIGTNAFSSLPVITK